MAMTQEEKAAVIWWAIDDALKKASSGFINYESMAREHISELVNEIEAALDRNGLQIIEKAGVPPVSPPSQNSVNFQATEESK